MAFRANVSPLEEFTTRVLALVVEQPDLTLVETVAELRRIRTSRSSGGFSTDTAPSSKKAPLALLRSL
jgi:hypothetical protein